MKVTLDIDDEIIRDAIGSAHIRYWARCLTWEREDLILELEEHEGIHEDGDGTRIKLQREDFERGLVVLAGKFPGAFVRLKTRTGDAYTGDLLIQCAAFGEEKYA